MIICTINRGISRRALEILENMQGFRRLSANTFTGIPLEKLEKFNEYFGGNVISYPYNKDYPGYSKDLKDLSKLKTIFKEKVLEWAKGQLPPKYIFNLGYPSRILTAMGFPELPITLSADYIEGKSEKGKHNEIDKFSYYDLMEAIHNPIFITRPQGYKGNILLHTYLKDKNNQGNIQVAIELNKQFGRTETNAVVTVYGMKGLRNINDFFERKLTDETLIFVNKKKALDYLEELVEFGDNLKYGYSHNELIKMYANVKEAKKLIESFKNTVSEEQVKFQQAIVDGNEDYFSTDEDARLAKEEIHKILPGININIVDDYIKSIFNIETRITGAFYNGALTLSKKSKDILKTAKHEAFHAAFELLKEVNPDLYEKVLEEASLKYRIPRGESNVREEYRLVYEGDIAIEERLAEAFEDVEIDVPTTWIERFWQWLQGMIKLFTSSHTERVFDDIRQGKYRKYSKKKEIGEISEIAIDENVSNAYIYEFNKHLLDEVDDHLDEIQLEVYRKGLSENPKVGLFEIAVQANSSTTGIQAIRNAFGDAIVDIAIRLFPNAKLGSSLSEFSFHNVQLSENPLSLLENNIPLLQRAIISFLKKGVIQLSTTTDISETNSLIFNNEDGNLHSYKKYEDLMVFHGWDRNMFIEEVTADGVRAISVNSQYRTSDAINQNFAKDKQASIISYLTKTFNLKGKVEVISKEDFANQFPEQYRANMGSAVHNGTVYIFTEATNQITAEELLHPFVETLYQKNKVLFDNLLKEASSSFPELKKEVWKNYEDDAVREKELVTKAIARAYDSKQGVKKSLLKKFQEWLGEIIKNLLSYFGLESEYINPATFDTSFTINEIANIINSKNTRINVIFPKGTVYNLESTDPTSVEEIKKEILNRKSDEAVKKILLDLPDAIKKVEKTIEKGGSQVKELKELVKTLKDSDNRENIITIQLNSIIKVVNMLQQLQDKLNVFNKSENISDFEKIVFAMSIHKTAESLAPFRKMMVELSNELYSSIGKSKLLKSFYNVLAESIALQDKLSNSVISKIRQPIVEIYASTAEPFYIETLNAKKQEIADLEAQLRGESDNLKQADASKKLAVKKRELADIEKYAPTKENIQSVFDGEHSDANAMSRIFEVMMANGHPVIQSFALLVDGAYLKAHQTTIQQRNILQTALDDLIKSLGTGKRDIAKINEPILDRVVIPKSVKVDNKGNVVFVDGKPVFETVTTKTLVSNTDLTYVTLYLEHQVLVDYCRDHLYKAYREGLSSIEIEGRRALLRKAAEEFKEFQREFSQDKYDPRVREMWDILNTVVSKKGDVEIRLKDLTKDAYREIDQLETAIDLYATSEEKEAARQRIKMIRANIKNLKNPLDRNGNEKTGEAKHISDLLLKYEKEKYTYGRYEVTESTKRDWMLDVQILEDMYEKDIITEEEFNYRRTQLIKFNFSKEYNDIIEKTSEAIDEILDELINILERSENSLIKSYFPNDYREFLQKSQEKIRLLARDFRDENNIIDGVFMYEHHKNLVKQVKEIQQAVEDFKYKSATIGMLSKEEKERKADLIKRGKRDSKEFKDLVDKETALKRFRESNKEIFEVFYNLIERRSGLSNITETEYYRNEKDHQLNLIKSEEETIEIAKAYVQEHMASTESDKPFNVGERSFVFKDDRWYEMIKKKRKSVLNPMFDIADNSDTGAEAVENVVISRIAEQKLKETEWWKDSHYTRYVRKKIKKQYRYVPTEVPTYVWSFTWPKDEETHVVEEPAQKYKKYVVYDEYVNKNLEYIYKEIPAPQPGKFVSDKVQKLPEPYKKYLDIITSVYFNSQAYLPERDKMGVFLPSIVKTKGENEVYFTQRLLDGQFQELLSENMGVSDEDTSYLLHGSLKNDKVIPKRFIGAMDESRQSSNVVAMVGLFGLHSALFNSLNEMLPVFEATDLLLQHTPVQTESYRLARKNFARRVKTMFKRGDRTEDDVEYSTLEGNESELSKTFSQFLNMFVYGQVNKEAIINMGPLGKVDMQKFIKGLSSFVGKTIFIGSIIPALNNSFSTRIQAIIQSGIKGGDYTVTDVIAGQGIALKYSADLMYDWTKMGAKSLIGQILEHYDVVPEGVEGEITKKSEHTLIKAKWDFLTSPKSISEFEVLFSSIFLPLANATFVDTAEGKVRLSEFEKIYELKDGNLQLKPGVKWSEKQERLFIMRFKNLSRRVGGAYRALEKTGFETEWYGHAMMFMRKYFVPLLTTRLAGKRWSIEDQKVTEGFWRSTVRNLVGLVSEDKGNIKEHWDKLTDDEKLAYRKALTEVAIIALINTAIWVFGGVDDKEELKKNSYFYNMMLVMLLRAKSETETFNFLFGYDELARMAKQPFIMASSLGHMSNAISLLHPTVFNMEDAYYKQNTGLHDKGDSKLLAASLRVFGYTGYTFNLEEYIINFRNMQDRVR